MQVRASAAVLTARRVSMLLRAAQLALRLAVRGLNLSLSFSLSLSIYIYIYIYIYIAGAGTCRRAGALGTAREGLSLRAVQLTLWLATAFAAALYRVQVLALGCRPVSHSSPLGRAGA